MMLVRKGGKKP